MNIGILIFSEPSLESYAQAERLIEAASAMGHTGVKLYEPYFSFLSSTILYQNEPLPPLDVIVVRPNFVEEPSLHTYSVHMLAQAGYRMINHRPGFTWTKNKLMQHTLFAKHELPCPRWGIARGVDEAMRIGKTIGFPVVVKVAFGTHGKGVFFAPSSEVFLPIVDYLIVRDGNPIIVEEFIEEAHRTDLRVFVIGGEVVAAMQRKAQEEDIRANTSNGGTGSTVQLTQQEMELAQRAAAIFELDIAGVDMIRSSHGPLLLEINANPGFKELERVTRVDIAKAIIEYAVDKAKI